MEVFGPVLLFDGECGLCVRCVQLLLKTDRRGRLRFAALQGGAAQALLRVRGLPTQEFESMVLVPEWTTRHDAGLLFRTDALFEALRTVGGVWWMLAWFGVLPRVWRDLVYRLVARWRRRIFGAGNIRALRERGGTERFLD